MLTETPGQSGLGLGIQVQMTVTGQMPGRRNQHRLQAFGARVVQRLGPEPDRLTHLGAMGRAPLASTGFAAQIPYSPTDEAFAMQAGDGLQLVQYAAARLAGGLPVAGLDTSEDLAAFVDTHGYLGVHACGRTSLPR